MFSSIGIEICVDHRLAVANNFGTPIFYEESLSFRFAENISTDTVVGRVSAYCLNETPYHSRGTVSYSLVDNPIYNSKFAINSTTGEIRSISVLDYDENPYQSLFELQISAVCKDSNLDNIDMQNTTLTYTLVQLELIDL